MLDMRRSIAYSLVICGNHKRQQLPQYTNLHKLITTKERSMKIAQSFNVDRPADAVWTFFQDVPAVAACLPGAELIKSAPDGTQRGKVRVNLGPFKAKFVGEA